MISTSGASSVYRSINPPTAADRQGAKPPAVSIATLRRAMGVRPFSTGEPPLGGAAPWYRSAPTGDSKPIQVGVRHDRAKGHKCGAGPCGASDVTRWSALPAVPCEHPHGAMRVNPRGDLIVHERSRRTSSGVVNPVRHPKVMTFGNGGVKSITLTVLY